ncbi:MAG: DUF1553 domain-containing protein [Pirellulaceae bacterium]|nr:DUF1553 domain-containing protein [Pirellulaceae bacterium]
MIDRRHFCLALTVTVLCCGHVYAIQRKEVSLFNGRDLQGLTPMLRFGGQSRHRPLPADQEEWYVSEGILVWAARQYSWVKCKGEYSDFELHLEFNVSVGAAGGVYVRCPRTGNLAQTGMAIRIADPDLQAAKPNMRYIRTGSIIGVVEPEGSAQRPVNQWNSMNIRCQGDRVQVTLNGVRVLDLSMNSDKRLRHRPRSGIIGLGSGTVEQDGPAAFRNIRIREIESARPPVTIRSPSRPATKRSSSRTAIRRFSSRLATTSPLPARQGEARFRKRYPGNNVTEAGIQPKSAKVDLLVFDRLKQLGIQRADVCSDEVFVRRVYLDVIGTLPTPREAKKFLRDRNPNKRRILIDRLLERPEFADYWAMKWGDVLRVKAEFPINLWPNAVQAYHRWIRTSIKQNKPYDEFAREMLTGSGSNFRDPQVNFYRAIPNTEPQTIAQAVALTFMGVRAENWPEDRMAGLAAFFSRGGYKATKEWKEEIVYFDMLGPAEDAAANVSGPAIFPDGTPARLSEDEDPREVFADWLITPQNPWFARNIVNRIWYWLVGRGIIHEPDDIRPDNPPQNPELLDLLEHELITARYDLKHIYRLILNSKTYQLSSISKSTHPDAEANFAYYPLRRLDAEVLLDALCQISGTTEEYSSKVPVPFTFIPGSQRTIALADGSITSPFLEMFGRPPRDTGLLSERNNEPTSAQAQLLLNDKDIQRKVELSLGSQALYQPNRGPRQVVEDVYLAILSRFPTEEELMDFQAHFDFEEGLAPEALFDLTWALINTPEFLCRH